MKVVTADQMREIEARAARTGLTSPILMENAGLTVAREIRGYLGGVIGSRICVLVGPGNNGGDGLVAARHLHRWGAQVVVYLCARRPAADSNLKLVIEQGMSVVEGEGDANQAHLGTLLTRADAVVDALFGAGRVRALEGIYRDTLLKLGEERRRRPGLKVIAVDLPSGLNPDTGATDPACPVADLTVTLSSPKLGLYAFPGAGRTGKIVVCDIGIPQALTDNIPVSLVTPEWVRRQLPPRPFSAHKGDFGKVMVVAGSINYTGAAYLACGAACRAGAGLVTLAAARSLVPVLAAKLTETTYLPLPEDDGYISAAAAAALGHSLARYDALLIGCGIAQNPGTVEFVRATLLPPLASLGDRIVVDADALNILAQTDGWHKRFHGNAVLTPHAGEMARLTGKTVKQIQDDRLETARRAAGDWQKTVLLKGAFSVVASPDGSAMINPIAEPSLSSAGTGDVLAGIIIGLLAQGVGPIAAAAAGAYLHGAVGQMVAADVGHAGVVASDLLPAIPRVYKNLEI